MYEEYIQEEWKSLPWDYDYLVSNTGKVMSLKDINNPVILDSIISEQGYLEVNIQDEYGLLKNYRVDILVAMMFTFNPDPINFTLVQHIDGNIQNNVYMNLMWVLDKSIEQNYYNTRISEQQALEILDLLCNEGYMIDISKIYNISYQSMLNIKYGLTYNDIRKFSLNPLFIQTGLPKDLNILVSKKRDNGKVLSIIEVLEIYNLTHSSELNSKQIAHMYNISPSAVQDIKHGRRSAKITGHKR